MPEQEDYLSHYGVPGMKWGKRKAAERQERNATIDGARARQSERKAEIRALTAKRIKARTQQGKQKIDSKIADKEFALKNNPDARTAAQLKAGEKVMKGVKITALLGLSVVGLGTAASIINQELNAMSRADNTTITDSQGASRSLVVGSNTNNIALNTPGNTEYSRMKGLG